MWQFGREDHGRQISRVRVSHLKGKWASKTFFWGWDFDLVYFPLGLEIPLMLDNQNLIRRCLSISFMMPMTSLAVCCRKLTAGAVSFDEKDGDIETQLCWSCQRLFISLYAWRLSTLWMLHIKLSLLVHIKLSLLEEVEIVLLRWVLYNHVA